MDPTGGVGASGEKEEAWEGAGLEMGEGKVAVLLWVVRTPGQDQAEGGGGSPLGVGGGGGGWQGSNLHILIWNQCPREGFRHSQAALYK